MVINHWTESWDDPPNIPAMPKAIKKDALSEKAILLVGIYFIKNFRGLLV